MRDLFTEDFAKLVIEGDDAWDTVRGYVESVAPDLAERVEKFERGPTGGDVFATYRIDEQIQKGLDRKVWLPSGGSLIIDRTEAMTVVDVNTGKFTGSGGNLEETVTKNNLEAAEEIVRQLRLRDIGGIIVVDFIDMVLESNRDLVVRRLVECLGRDRTRHQVAEVTSLGLVQMTRKRIGTGLLEAFSENCEHCHGRGVVIKDQPVDPDAQARRRRGPSRQPAPRTPRLGERGRPAAGNGDGNGERQAGRAPRPVAQGRRRDGAPREARREEAARREAAPEAAGAERPGRERRPTHPPRLRPRRCRAPSETVTEPEAEAAEPVDGGRGPSRAGRAGRRGGARRGREAAGGHAYASPLRQPSRRPAGGCGHRARVGRGRRPVPQASSPDATRRVDAQHRGVEPGQVQSRRSGRGADGRARPDQEEGLAQALSSGSAVADLVLPGRHPIP